MLLDAKILQPGRGAMTIEYLGQKFVGDLLPDGRIRSQETDIAFATPSAWAIACKRFINPDKKSGCGWASVKYKGRKLDAYKNIWYRKKKEEQEQEILENDSTELKIMSNLVFRMVVKHNTIANRTLTHDANTLIECVPFSNLGKIQPFLVTLSTNAALVMDFHSHLTKSEVSGYLAGHWDFNSHNLQVTHAFPCRNTKADRENASNVEAEISKTIEREKLLLVGWYHSHPFTAAAPTLRDVDAQLDYQIKMKGQSDNSYSPCIGIIISPYNYENSSLESSIIAYWVIPPPEVKPNEYGRPMLMSYSVSQDSQLTDLMKDEITKCAEYYKKEKDFINFNDQYMGNSLFIDKLKSTLISKFPREEKDTNTWKFIRDLVGCGAEENDSLLSIPSVSKPQILPTLNTPVSLNSMMLPQDISSLFYNSMNSGKYTSTSSMLGLPDPMAHSTLAANNMFLQSNLFKMQELLKPLSSSSPVNKTKEQTKTSSTLKIPSDIKSWKNEYQIPDVLNLKSNFLAPDLNLSKISSTDYTYKPHKDFNIADLSGMKNNMSDFSLDSCKSQNENEKSNVSKSSGYSMLDLSMSKNSDTQQSNELTLDLSQQPSNNDNTPLNLTQ
ncbi:MPN domain-containing protein CG4751-like isoform X2 [Harmonia axyridis]|nr:MPN domain-containing protein CG4751-like isoform X2 [Harmonia axyridis]XP_045470929.1 MPN domain-containing protein CG4751-like isoform X2 [Harmonia axyridis]XP_045470930.1 MPN domain-containing protein CG4751-like isoform X2 [Harmonia axyridis]XP_045470931.1 MPN domain-containing protein CG4751-like isoform X2 [Harmonia axyridis]XP_045470932.1 MPN domain-containing protein CG4751-like isoform X2 [Harmonia axyridis]